MRIIFLVILLTIAVKSTAQKDTNGYFDSTNYFDHFYDGSNNPKIKGKGLTVDWLNITDAKKIMTEEFKNNHLDSFIEEKLYQIDTNKFIILTYYFPEANIGILYTQDHVAIPMPTKRIHRYKDEYFRIYSKVMYDKPVGKPKLLMLNTMPDNIIIVNQNYYWFEDTGNREDDKYLVTKDVAKRILREDLKTYLTQAKKM